jgi:hypothetical protein
MIRPLATSLLIVAVSRLFVLGKTLRGQILRAERLSITLDRGKRGKDPMDRRTTLGTLGERFVADRLDHLEPFSANVAAWLVGFIFIDRHREILG